MSSQILLFSGPGTGPFCTRALEEDLQELSDGRYHQVVRFNDFDSCWSDPKSIKAIVVPGGNAYEIWIKNKLEQKASAIRDYIKKYDISYYGVCAGAIIATSSFHQSDFEEPSVHRGFDTAEFKFLSIFPHKILGPISDLPPRPPNKLDIKNICLLNLQPRNQEQTIPCVNILGPGFLNCENQEGMSILSEYTHLKSAAFTSFGPSSGKSVYESSIDIKKIAETVLYEPLEGPPVLLTGSHPEIHGKILETDTFKTIFNISYYEEMKIAFLKAELDQHEVTRKAQTASSLERIGITCKK